MKLQLLPSNKINKKKWDECLNNSSHLIYASSVYLDHMADNWDGIVSDNYQFIMPIPWRQKFGIKYCYKVPFIQQLGIFGKAVNENDVRECIKLMLKFYRYGDYSFNYINDINQGKTCCNYTLSLASNYKLIFSSYSHKLRSDLLKAEKYSLQYQRGNAREALEMFQKLYASKISAVTLKDYNNFYLLCNVKEKEDDLIVRKIMCGENVLAINLLFKDRSRIYNLIACTTPEGRAKLAGHFLYDRIINEYSGTGLIFDFEGSDIAGIAHFYKSFGAIGQSYKKIHFNRLPYFLKLFKS